MRVLLRCRYGVIATMSLLMVVGGSLEISPDTDWQFFTWGSDMLLGHQHPFIRSNYQIVPELPGGLNIYANYPFLQIGPPPLLLAAILQIGPRDGVYAAAAVVQSLAILFIVAAERAGQAWSAAARSSVFIGGTLLAVVWGSLSQYRHLDDALAVTALGAAAWAITRQRAVAAGLLLGFSAACKPWAIPLLALALAPTSPSHRARCLCAAVVGATVWWAPFVVAAPDTLLLGQVELYLSPASALASLGVDEVANSQSLRIVQFGAGTLLTLALVQGGWWTVAPIAAFAARLLLDPSAYSYYTAPLVAAALLADLTVRPGRFPALTGFTTALWVATEAAPPGAAGLTRLVGYGALVLLAICLLTRRGPGYPSPTRGAPA